ncbi:MAG: hypothetical protein NE327_14850 [Lentisphaeraceae bacterium]|nr:hypothetical protein [Lentisphaeraceae bacterium]
MNSYQSTPDKTLVLSFKLLSDWENTPNFDLILAEQRKEDNSEVTDMTAFTCRNYFRNKHYIDWLIKTKADKRPRGRIRRVLGIALSQLLDAQLEPSIICDTAVRFCKKKYSKFDASFVNQFLRSITAEDFPKAPYEVTLGLSHELLAHWKKTFSKQEIEDIAEILKTPSIMTARLSPANPDIEDLMDYLKPLGLPEWAKNFKIFEVTNAKKFIKENNNRLYIQDPAPLLSIGLLNPQKGEVIADLCSAPGGKSLLIAQLLNGSGKLISSDFSDTRLKQVEENLAGFSNCEIKQMDARKPSIPKASLDGLLLDVPCSNTGVIRRKADVRWTFNQSKLRELSELQYEILQASSCLIKPGGRIVYSTCSICPQENIQVVERFISANPQFKIDTHKTLLPTQDHDGSFSCSIILSH